MNTNGNGYGDGYGHPDGNGYGCGFGTIDGNGYPGGFDHPRDYGYGTGGCGSTGGDGYGCCESYGYGDGNGYCVRIWGTSHGLGEIALDGPTSSSVLDYFGRGFISSKALLYTIDCDETKWSPEKINAARGAWYSEVRRWTMSLNRYAA